MASLEIEKEKTDFRDFYVSTLLLRKTAENSFRTLITSLRSGNVAFPSPVVTSRLKDREECIGKFIRTYQADLEEQALQYEIRPHITDLIGARITCYYETNLPYIHAVLTDNLKVLDTTHKTSSLERRDDTFRYKGSHLHLRLNNQRCGLPELYTIRRSSIRGENTSKELPRVSSVDNIRTAGGDSINIA
jgi:putative GTP pyrophosphokinase